MYGMRLNGAGDWEQGMRFAAVGSAPVPRDGRFFTLEQRALMKGEHLRRREPALDRTYVAGVALPRRREPGLLAEPVTITIVEMQPWDREAALHIVQHVRWAQEAQGALIPRLKDLLWGVWGCQKVVINGAASGQRVLSVMEPDPLHGVTQLVGEATSRAGQGLALLAAVGAGRVKMYADDGSAEHREFWAQAVRARSHRIEGEILDFYVEPSTGDDGVLMSLALAVGAARSAIERRAEPVPA